MVAGAREAIVRRLPAPTPRDVRKVCSDYRRVFGRFPNLLKPRRFTEKIQWRKLFDLDPLYTTITDKIAARDFIAARVGAQWLAPLLWMGQSPDEIPFDQLTAPYVLKCNHGSGFNIVVTDTTALDRDQTRQRLNEYLSSDWSLREPAYFMIRRRISAEQLMLENDGSPPLEHKIFVFGGRARLVWTIFQDASRKRYDAACNCDWKPLYWLALNPQCPRTLEKPRQAAKFIELAEKIGAGFDFLRVDFYEWREQPVVGELTLYNLSGLTPFKPDEADDILGSYWELQHPVGRAVLPLIAGVLRAVRERAGRIRRRLRPGLPV